MSRVVGLQSVLGALGRYRRHQGHGVARGLKKAGLFLQRASMDIVPVEYGPLRASASTVVESGTGLDTVVAVGYSDEKAIYVHEIPHSIHAHGKDYNEKWAYDIARGIKWARGPNQQWKFLERPARENRTMLKKIVAEEAIKATNKPAAGGGGGA